MLKLVLKKTYDDENDLKDGTGFVSAPIRITEECSNEREDINSSSPFADVIGRINVTLLQNPS